MKILLVPDRFQWGAHHSAEAVARVCKRDHDFTIAEAVNLSDDMFKDVDLVVAWLNWSEPFIKPFWRRHKFPVATRIGGWNGVFRAGQTALERAMRGVVCCSPMLSVAAQNIFKCPVVSIPNGVDSKAFVPARRIGEGWGWVGRTTDRQKGYRWLHSGELRDIAFNEKTQQRVKGSRDAGGADQAVAPTRWPREMVEYYQGLYGLLSTSYFEGSCNVILEAMSCALPVVATPAGVAPFLLEPRWLCSVPPQMRQRIAELGNRELAIDVGARNRKVIEKGWDWTARRESYVSFFEGCLRK